MVTRPDIEVLPSDSDSDGLSYVQSDIEEDGGSLFSDSPAPIEGQERWRASPTPVETFGDVEMDREWSCQIIGEELDKDEKTLSVRWDNWQRADGTNTTWETDDTTVDLSVWKKAQKKHRRNLANQTIEIDVHTTTDVHNTRTYLRSQAYQEKLDRVRREPQPDYFADMAKLLAKRQGDVQPNVIQRHAIYQGSSSSPLALRSNQRASTRQQTELSIASSTTLARASSTVSIASVSSVTATSISKAHLASLSQNSSSTSLPTVPSIPALDKGKGKEVAIPEYPEPYSIDVPQPPSTAPSAKAKGKRRAPPSEAEDSDFSMSSVHAISAQHPTASSSAKKKRTRVIRSESSENVAMLQSPSPPSPPIRIGPPRRTPSTPNTSTGDISPAHKLRQLQQAWSAVAKRNGAAPIYFVNEIDDSIPELDPSFRYLESTYIFSPTVQKPDAGFLTSCSCKDCRQAKTCDCQIVSELRNEADVPFFAYTHSGLYAFNLPRLGVEVVECNQMCSCTNCDNRVSQIPRDVPVEVFKTRHCGWGVRPTINVQRGKVLGIYTGFVHASCLVRLSRRTRLPFDSKIYRTREEAESIPIELSGYRFDLDGDEAEGIEVTHPLYTVDSRLHGNWTRFINHSCSPNLEIYLVVHDTPPQCGLPYIAFVASHDIPARTEFTFDYDPKTLQKLAEVRAKAKGRKKGRNAMVMPEEMEGGQPCSCGSVQCRGFIIV
ncbi:hypothetical protein CVT26_003657 [Gymnopilus dilepis]|uniref:SET domain-containing protein n=1 Tax=Gymnopilus dilepis TaxID=231916 RepID=A0A409VSI8_9AGAR|nr:hypothetical protein CVT26_003657 [Gymnopilus dilepis]